MTMTPERLAELDAAMAKATAVMRDYSVWLLTHNLDMRHDCPDDDPASIADDVDSAQRDLRAHIDAQAATIARATEMLAKLIYSEWQGQEGFVPWVENGNSFKQDDARDIARAALTGAA